MVRKMLVRLKKECIALKTCICGGGATQVQEDLCWPSPFDTLPRWAAIPACEPLWQGQDRDRLAQCAEESCTAALALMHRHGETAIARLGTALQEWPRLSSEVCRALSRHLVPDSAATEVPPLPPGVRMVMKHLRFQQSLVSPNRNHAVPPLNHCPNS